MKTTHILKILNGAGGGRPDSDFNPQWLEVGINIEMEHTSRRDVAKIIAKAHLTEFPRYYQYLLRMEEEMKQEQRWEQYLGK
jgi:hypothetical protein